MQNIFPNIYYFVSELDLNYIKKLKKNIAIIYRNYTKKIDKKGLNNLKILCKKQNRKLYLANDYKLAVKMNLDGVYIPSFNQKLNINLYAKKKSFIILGSAHNIKEIKIKEKQNVQCIFLSPVFKVAKSNNYLGISLFKNLMTKTNCKIIALGGINLNNLKKLKILNCYGFASISLIKENQNF
jgi:thiamine-phosphate pyrophosphorylase